VLRRQKAVEYDDMHELEFGLMEKKYDGCCIDQEMSKLGTFFTIQVLAFFVFGLLLYS
jgi:hypothetical protein